MSVASPFSISFASSFSSQLPLHSKEHQTWPWVSFLIYHRRKACRSQVSNKWVRQVLALTVTSAQDQSSPSQSIAYLSAAQIKNLEGIFHCSLFLIFISSHPVHQQILLVLLSKYIWNSFLSTFQLPSCVGYLSVILTGLSFIFAGPPSILHTQPGVVLIFGFGIENSENKALVFFQFFWLKR